jgi:UDP-glucose 4-epimerase
MNPVSIGEIISDIVFIYATIPIQSWNNPYIEIEENLRTSRQLYALTVQPGVRKIVFASSGGTVYSPQNQRVNEKVTPNPFSPYGITRLVHR